MWSGQRVRLYDTYTDFPEGNSYGFTADHLQKELKKGYTFVHVDTHGDTTGWNTEEGPEEPVYPFFYADTLINSGYSVIVTSACSTNDYISNTSLGHSFIANPNSGIISYIGYPIESYFPYSFYINRGLYSELFSDVSHKLGTAFKNNHNRLIGTSNTYELPIRWNLLAWNMSGDPETPLFLSEPMKFSNVDARIQGDSLIVNTGLSNCRICVRGDEDDHNDYYMVVDSVMNYTFHNIGNSGTICITKNGYIPYLIKYNNNLFIQNETFSEDYHVISNNVTIGSNVTTAKPNGPVVIDRGAAIINADNVIITNGFEVRKGASLEIIPTQLNN